MTQVNPIEQVFYGGIFMKIEIHEYGLKDTLERIREYLEEALSENNKRIKNEYIGKAYGAVTTIDSLVATMTED